MAQHEIYELWAQRDKRWELLAWFRELDVANTVAHKRHATGVRLVHAIHEQGQPVQRDTLAEIGTTRQQP